MYYCLNCETFFEDEDMVDDVTYVPHSELAEDGAMPYETIHEGLCPNCRSNDFQEAGRCELCGKPTEDIAEELCESCRADLLRKYTSMLDVMATGYGKSKGEMDRWLMSAIDGAEF